MVYKVSVLTHEYSKGRRKRLLLRNLKDKTVTFQTKEKARKWINKQIEPKQFKIIKR